MLWSALFRWISRLQMVSHTHSIITFMIIISFDFSVQLFFVIFIELLSAEEEEEIEMLLENYLLR